MQKWLHDVTGYDDHASLIANCLKLSYWIVLERSEPDTRSVSEPHPVAMPPSVAFDKSEILSMTRDGLHTCSNVTLTQGGNFILVMTARFS